MGAKGATKYAPGPRHKIEVKKLIGISRSFHQKISPEINLISSKQLMFIDL